MKKLGFNPLNTIPRDIVSKRVVYDDGDHYNPKIKAQAQLFSTSALPIRTQDKIPTKVKNDPNFKDLSGIKIGYFTVIGLFLCNVFDKWVLKCCCGNYEVRRAKTLKKITDQVDQNRCQSCVDLERLRNRDYFKIHGQYPWQEKKSRKLRRNQKYLCLDTE